MFKATPPSFILLAVLAGCAAAAGCGADAPEAWSKPVNGLQARLCFARKEVLAGTPLLAAYLELRNVSSSSNALELPVDGPDIEYRFTVTDGDGKSVPATSTPYDEIRADVGVVRIPFDSLLRLNITHRGAGVAPDQAASLDLGPLAVWSFRRGDTQTYYLQAELTVKKGGGARWSGTLRTPRAKLPTAGD